RRARRELAGLLFRAAGRGTPREGVPRAARRAVPPAQRGAEHVPLRRVRAARARARARGLAGGRAPDGRAASPRTPAARRPAPAATACPMAEREWLGSRSRREQ